MLCWTGQAGLYPVFTYPAIRGLVVTIKKAKLQPKPRPQISTHKLDIEVLSDCIYVHVSLFTPRAYTPYNAER
jgi:hypothetical protein